MQTVILPMRSPQTGFNTIPSAYFSSKGADYQKAQFIGYGNALADRLLLRGLDISARITIATTQHDLDNITQGVLDALQPRDCALNVMFIPYEPRRITVVRHEERGSRSVLIVPVHVLNEAFIVRDIIARSCLYNSFQRVFIVTPVIVGDSYRLLDSLIGDRKPYSSELISLHDDRTGRFRRFSESRPVYDDMRSVCDPFILASLRRTAR